MRRNTGRGGKNSAVGRPLCRNQRNLRTRRRKHLCIQDDRIGAIFLRKPNMARLPPTIITQNIFCRKQPSLSAGTRYTYSELALLCIHTYKGTRRFLTRHTPSCS
jgi:hypothetical protein